jgi:hypothetical protein
MKKWKDPLEEAEERLEREKKRAEERGSGDARDHYDRPSWKELDARRDKAGGSAGGGRREGGGEGGGMASLNLVSRRNPSAQKNYRAMLDRAFDGGSLGAVLGKDKLAPLGAAGPDAERNRALRQAILEAIGGEAATKALRAYVDAGLTLPDDDLDLLGAAAQSDDEAFLPAPLQLLVALCKRRPVKRVAALRQRARFLADQAKADAVRTLAAELVALLPTV